uniref:FIIND domain-containing protein n=1 Tax=Pelodiscus sinensis TaxID=13735 RepID=K7G4J6_PELSI
LPGAGSFRCSETELGFVVRAAVTVQYGYDSWARRLGASERQQWMVAGPLFSIRAEPAGAVAAVQRGAADERTLQVAHIADGGLTLEEPAQVRPFHAVLENPSFSFVGVLWRPLCAIFPFIPIHSVGLIYRVLQAADITLHLYLIPNDRSLIQAVDDEERKHRSIQVLKPPQTKPLYFGSHYTVSSSLDLEVTPEEVEFRYMSPEDQQPFMEIYTRGMTEGLKLVLVMKGYGEVLWKVWVRPEDVMLLGSSS